MEVHVSNFCSWEISDFDFPISGHRFLDNSRYCSVHQNKCSTFPPFLIVFLYSVVVCVIDIFCLSSLDFFSCVILFIGMFYSLLYFCHRAVLSFRTAERLLFRRFINYNIKIYTRWFTANSFSTKMCIKFANYCRRIFTFIKFGFS